MIYRIAAGLASVLLLTALWGQRFRFPGEDDDLPLPPDANEKTEFYFARLRYSGFGGWRRGGWTTDYPKADRQFLQGVRRLSRIHARSVEQVVDPDSPELFNYPWIYAVEVGRWGITDAQGVKLREYINRGGFLMTDDFHGTAEWEVFIAGLRKIFPDRTVADLENVEPVFHVLYDLDDRFQVPGIQYLRSGSTFERDGYEPKWRGIFDDQHRLVVAICHNMDVGDAWEWADLPAYPEKYASLAYRIGLNYIIYPMTH
ncbi:MAG: DUF4159 domain-containing protein [Bryobacterales bacterium]|nr:DUF4159 domain-containing protein [Bryobacterales bacterium]